MRGLEVGDGGGAPGDEQTTVGWIKLRGFEIHIPVRCAEQIWVSILAKTFLVTRIVVALCALYPNLTGLWTAHRTRTTTKTFEGLRGYVSKPQVKKYLDLSERNEGIRKTNGEQEIRFANGSVIMFGAREQGFGRGFSEVDIEVFDEAQILTESALEDMVPATNQSRFPHGALLFFMGTPPRPKDPGEEFSNRRKEALALKPKDQVVGIGGDGLYIELGADDNVGQPDGPGLMDEAQLLKANPSYPHRTPPASIKRMRKNLTNDDSWKREALGVWDGDGIKTWQLVGRKTWEALKVTGAPDVGPIAFGVKFSADGERYAVGAAIKGADGKVFVEAIGVTPTAHGTSNLIAWLRERATPGVKIAIDGKAGATDLANSLKTARIPQSRIQLFNSDQATAAHAGFLNAILEQQLTHSGQPGLDAQLRVAERRPIGKLGGFGWQATIADHDVTALEAVTLAYGVVKDKPAGPVQKRKVISW